MSLKGLIEDFNRAKQELREADKKGLPDLDGYWDELEVAWYALLDHHSQDELEDMGYTLKDL